ncbi:MAG: DMP19 family protein [Verrucomicrobiaceae bacterium]
MGGIPSPVIWIIGIGLLVIVAVAIFKNREDSQWGFKDAVKNPDYWDAASQARQEADEAAKAAKNWSDDQVASAARHFVLEVTTSREAWGEAQILRELGQRPHPTVLKLLGDEDLYDRLVKPTGEDLLAEAPFNRACDILGDAPPKEAVAALALFLNDPSEQIRKDAALAIAKTGAAEIIPHVRKAFSDTDAYVRSYALMGLEFSLNRDGLADTVPGELFSDVKNLLEKGNNSDKAADILFRFNSEEAIDFFLSSEVFSADSRIIHEVLETLADAKVPVQRELLLGLISALDTSDFTYPRAYALGEALRLLGQMQNPEDREFLSARLIHSEDRVAEGAAAGLLCSHGLEGFEQRIWESEEKSGYDSLPDHQRYYSAVFMCDAEVNNGGLAQYFVNSSGDNWRDALAGLESMGSTDRLVVVREAISLFGSDGPSENRDKRQDQLSKLYKKNDSIFDALESRYYDSDEVIEVLATRFVLANPDSFR